MAKAKKEISAGAIVYYLDEKPFFLLLKNTLKKTFWAFPKGHIEENESQEQAALRETEEETGLKNLKIIPGFKHFQRWFFKLNNELIYKEACFFLIKITKQEAEKTKISSEHEDFSWLPYEESMKLMKIKQNREMLKATYKFIKEYEKQKQLFT